MIRNVTHHVSLERYAVTEGRSYKTVEDSKASTFGGAVAKITTHLARILTVNVGFTTHLGNPLPTPASNEKARKPLDTSHVSTLASSKPPSLGHIQPDSRYEGVETTASQDVTPLTKGAVLATLTEQPTRLVTSCFGEDGTQKPSFQTKNVDEASRLI